MDRINTQQLSEIILTAPAWARIGITMPEENLRQRAATELAITIAERLFDYPDAIDRNQLPLPL